MTDFAIHRGALNLWASSSGLARPWSRPWTLRCRRIPDCSVEGLLGRDSESGDGARGQSGTTSGLSAVESLGRVQVGSVFHRGTEQRCTEGATLTLTGEGACDPAGCRGAF